MPILAVPARQKIIDAIPDALKTSIAVSVGVFVVVTGLRLAGIIVFENGLPSSLGSVVSAKAEALYIGLAVAAVLSLKRLRFVGGLLVAIIVAALFCKQQGILVTSPPQLSSGMWGAVLQLDLLSIVTDVRILPALLVFFLIDFYGSLGKFIALTKRTNLIKEDGTPVRVKEALYVDGIGTVAGAVVGTSSIITYVVSAVGIAVGGRTGVTAIVCAILMFCSLIFTPLVALIPVEATAGVLVYVGWLLLPREQWKKDGVDRFDAFVAVAMGAVVLFMFALDKAMLLGFALYSFRQITRWIFSNGEKVNWYLVGSTVLLGGSVATQYIIR